MKRSLQFTLMATHVACAAGTYVHSKLAADGFRSPEALTLARALGSTVVLLLLTGTLIPKPQFDGPTWAKLLGLGILHVPINQYLFLRGLKASVPSHGALLYALTPMGVLLFTSWLERRWPARGKLLGVLVALAGAVVVLKPWEQGDAAAKVRHGDFLLLLAVASWVFCTVATRSLSRRHDPRTVTAWTLILGALATMPIGGLALKQTDWAAVPGSAWLGLAWMVAITSVVMNLLWSQLLKHLHPVQVAVCMNAQPPATAALQTTLAAIGPAWLGATLAEPLGWPFWLGMALVLVGVVVVQRAGRADATRSLAPQR
jgi:drug/metabolite transporter (DMT)-like permease